MSNVVKEDLYDMSSFGRESVVRSAMKSDVVRSMQLATEIVSKFSDDSALKARLGSVENSRMYLDPVTSFSLENNGRGYGGEITLYVPFGFWRNFKSDSEKQLTEFREADAIRLNEWQFCNPDNADADGVLTAFWHNELFDKSLVLHMRELERDIQHMPESSIKYENDLQYLSGLVVPALNGNGMVQHATRSIGASCMIPISLRQHSSQSILV